MKIAYTGMDAAGAQVQGVVEAADSKKSVAVVRSLGLIPFSVREVGDDVPLSGPVPIDVEPVATGDEGGVAEAVQEDINAAIDKVAESCSVLRDGLLRRGFLSSDATELVKVFLANSMYSGTMRQG